MMSPDGEFTIDQIRFHGSALPLPAAPLKTRVKKRQPFLKGPIPLAWLRTAMTLPGKALHVALILWYFTGFNKQARPIVLSPTKLSTFGLKRETARRGLMDLEAAGLVTVERCGKRS